jgi:hypothetical protein
MGGRAFILLKAGCPGPKSAKQTEIRLATLLKILHTTRSGVESPLAMCERRRGGWVAVTFRSIWLIRGNRPLCYLDHSISTEIGAVSCKEMQVKIKQAGASDSILQFTQKHPNKSSKDRGIPGK